MTDREKAFFDRKLQATFDDSEAYTKVLTAVIKRCIEETQEKIKKDRERIELNRYYQETNFGL